MGCRQNIERIANFYAGSGWQWRTRPLNTTITLTIVPRILTKVSLKARETRFTYGPVVVRWDFEYPIFIASSAFIEVELFTDALIGSRVPPIPGRCRTEVRVLSYHSC